MSLDLVAMASLQNQKLAPQSSEIATNSGSQNIVEKPSGSGIQKDFKKEDDSAKEKGPKKLGTPKVSKQLSPAERRKRLFQLPQTRIRAIMKLTNEVQNISKDALHVTARATEMFIKHLTEKTQTPENGILDYNDLADTVQTNKPLDFLVKYIPKKITYKQFKEMMAKKKQAMEVVKQDSDLSNNCVFEYSSQESADDEVMAVSSADEE